VTETHHPPEILLVEDDALDAIILRRAVRELGWTNGLVHITGGHKALAHLKARDCRRPCIILLDLNMPGMTGFEFLELVKADEALQGIPVVVVTTSAEQPDRARSFELGAVAYIVKSPSYHEFRQSLQALRPYVAGAPPRSVVVPA
jgi:CheY-like chemotaxis protein